MDDYIEHSQCYTGLSQGRITPTQLLDTLLVVEPTCHHLMAYYHYLVIQRERGLKCPEQSVSSGEHFLICSPSEYVFLYMWMEFSLLIPSISLDEMKNRVATGMIRFYMDETFHRFILVMTGYKKRVSLQELEWALQALQYHVEFRGTFEVFWKALLTHHATSQLALIMKGSISREDIKIILDHCTRLASEHPSLWADLQPKYRSLIVGFLDRKVISFHPEIHAHLTALFADLFLPQTSSFTSLAWKIYYMSLTQAGYYLGFPIRTVIPTQHDVVLGLVELSTIGITEYTSRFRDCNKMYHEVKIKANTILLNYPDQDYRFINDRDTLYNDIFTYSPIDLHSFAGENGKFFLFSALDLSGLVQTRRNFYTNQDLPSEILDFVQREIHNRILPPPQPLIDLLNDLDQSKVE